MYAFNLCLSLYSLLGLKIIARLFTIFVVVYTRTVVIPAIDILYYIILNRQVIHNDIGMNRVRTQSRSFVVTMGIPIISNVTKHVRKKINLILFFVSPRGRIITFPATAK